MRIVPGLLLAALLLPPPGAAHADESYTAIVDAPRVTLPGK